MSTPSKPQNIAEGLMLENMALKKTIAYKDMRIQELEAENAAMKKWKGNSNALHEHLESIPPDIQKIVNEHFWDMIGDDEKYPNPLS